MIAYFIVLACLLYAAVESWDWWLARCDRINQKRAACGHAWEETEIAGYALWLCRSCGSQTHTDPYA